MAKLWFNIAWKGGRSVWFLLPCLCLPSQAVEVRSWRKELGSRPEGSHRSSSLLWFGWRTNLWHCSVTKCVRSVWITLWQNLRPLFLLEGEWFYWVLLPGLGIWWWVLLYLFRCRYFYVFLTRWHNSSCLNCPRPVLLRSWTRQDCLLPLILFLDVCFFCDWDLGLIYHKQYQTS